MMFTLGRSKHAISILSNLHFRCDVIMATKRVLVHLRSTQGGPVVLAPFTQSVIGTLSTNSKGTNDGKDEDEIFVDCELKSDGKLVLGLVEQDRAAPDRLHHYAPLRRPPQCPIKLLTAAQAAQISEEVTARGVAVGSVALVESADRHVLLTRRAKHMRTFPGVWVPPGGAAEPGETLLATALRELQEETGLDVAETSTSDVLCLWESVFPPFLERGLPSRHHIVVYFHVEVTKKRNELDQALVLQPEEVDAAAWLSESQIKLVIEGKDEDDSMTKNMESSFKMRVLQEDGTMASLDCPSEVLLAKAPVKGMDTERMSSGTRYALSEWLKLRKKREGSKL